MFSESQGGGSTLDFVIDGSNVLLANRVGGAPSIRAFASLLCLLDAEGKTFKVWFDNSIYHRVREQGGDVEELKRLIAELNHHRLLDMAPRADEGIQADCQKFGAAVINGGDKNDSWRAPVPPIFRCRLYVVGGRDLRVSVAPAGRGKQLFSTSVSHAFQFRGLSFPSLADTGAPPDIGMPWARPPRFKGRNQPGSLLVLALDASFSMNATDTFDGRTRAAHVSEIVRDSLAALNASKINEAPFLVCILSFANDVSLVSPAGEGYVFSPLDNWIKEPIPDYTANVDRTATNIRLALDRAADLIDGFKESEVARQLSLRWDKATVVMLSDGEHLALINGNKETSKDIVMHVFATLNRSEGVSFGFIGLGDGADHLSLQGWSTLASPQQNRTAAARGVQLESGRLYVKANSRDSKLGYIIRTFIDLASSRVEA
jgi:hypothetical protein